MSIIGSGNVATAVSIALSKSGINILEIFSPNINNAKLLAEKVNSRYVKELGGLCADTDLFLIATPDKEVNNVIHKLPQNQSIVAHTSGSHALVHSGINQQRSGVFYPLQTFTKDKEVDFKEIPVCIEASDENTSKLLFQLAKSISNNVVTLNSEQRQYLHLTAVAVNNFTNLLYNHAFTLLKEQNIDFALLRPLIRETALKITDINPADAQTGPARRNDTQTINKHLELLDKHPKFKEIYSLLSNQIIKKYHG